jgi:hypothetical protein
VSGLRTSRLLGRAVVTHGDGDASDTLARLRRSNRVVPKRGRWRSIFVRLRPCTIAHAPGTSIQPCFSSSPSPAQPGTTSARVWTRTIHHDVRRPLTIDQLGCVYFGFLCVTFCMQICMEPITNIGGPYVRRPTPPAVFDSPLA